MPGSLDGCINSIYEPGNIPGSIGTPPVRVLLRDPLDADISEAATADAMQEIAAIEAVMLEAAAADAVQDWIAGVPRSAMVPTAMINSDGTPRQANVDGTMINL